MQPEWLRYRERGSVFAYRLIAWIARALGRRLTRLLLYPICLYYMSVSRATARASRQYLEKVLGRPPTWREVFRHHYYFAATLLDRVYLFTGRADTFDIQFLKTDAMHEYPGVSRGCLMLSAHMGSHELARVYGLRRRIIVNMMMYEENAQKIGAVTQSLDPRHDRRIIPIGPIESLIVAKERLDRGEVVGVLADRVVSDERLVRVRFFGQEASFPAGPFLVAAVLKVPVMLFVSLYRGGNRYELYFEPLAEQITLNRHDPVELEQWVQRYAERLEYYCRLEPYNWFNFYDFWSNTAAESPATQPARTA